MSKADIRGKAGEEYTARRLENSGWKILARNYRIRGGEIDIVAEKGDTLIFVEVKTRRFGSLSDGEEAITERKKRLIIKTAQRFLCDNCIEDRYIRFDAAVLTVTTEDIPKVLEIRYYENAFDASDTDIY